MISPVGKGLSIYDVHTEGEEGQAQLDACGQREGSSPVTVLGFCVWGANGEDIFVWGAEEKLSAEGAKLRLPEARIPSRLGAWGSVLSSPSEVWGGRPDAILILSNQNGVHFEILLISHF